MQTGTKSMFTLNLNQKQKKKKYESDTHNFKITLLQPLLYADFMTHELDVQI